MRNSDDRHQTVILPPRKGFSTPSPASSLSKSSYASMSTPNSDPKRSSPAEKSDLFHVIHKVPSGNSPYVRAKHVQLIEKDPSRAISLFWSAINAGDRVDSSLKDMAIVMKQLNRSDEAIEAIKSFRHLCTADSQDSLDNVLVELYKRAGRVEEEIEMLLGKLKRIEEGTTFGGRRTKAARSQGKKVYISIDEEKSRILGNLAWAYLQLKNYKTAEEYYRHALVFEPDINKQCNLAICLMHLNRISEAKSLLRSVRALIGSKPMDESFAKSFERARETLTELGAGSELEPLRRESYSGNNFENKANSQEDIAALENMNSRFGLFGLGNNAQQQPVTVDQLKRDRPSTSHHWQRNTEPQLSSWNKRSNFSPAPFTQPRRCLWRFDSNKSCSSDDGDWRKKAFRENDDPNKPSTEECDSSQAELTTETTTPSSNAIDSSISCKKKMSWADMAEEEEDEEEVSEMAREFFKSSERFDSYESPCLQTQMNMRSNVVVQESPCLQTQMTKLDQSGSSKNQSVRRALCFDQGSKSFVPGKNVRLLRRNRLKVFQDITRSP